MLHALTSNADIQAQLQKMLADLAMLVGSILGVVLVQVANAVKDSHMNIVKKMIAERLVGYAEQTITTSGTDKAAYVAEQLKVKFPKMDEQEIKHLLESAVLNVTAQINAPAVIPPEGAKT